MSISAARRPVITRVGETTMGVLCATDPRFQPATATSPGTFPAEPQLLKESILALGAEADLVVVSLHAGIEFYRLPSPRQMALAELCLESGAQVVAFHHSHCTSGVWSDNRGIVLFGMGDYLFPTPSRPTLLSRHESAAWHVTFAASASNEIQVQPHPVVLDRDGLPTAAVGSRAERILGRVDRYSHRLKDGRVRKWWHLLELLRPGHLWVNLHRTTHSVRKRGVRVTLKNLVEGLRLQYR
jgi:poly-gamma-glutamate capsule biosynthesis protein CapA/YwtB (metallophosphatase superfamily)